MTPQDHKNAINAAMMRCVRYRDTENSGEAVEAHDAAVAALALDYEVSLRNAEYLEAKLQKLAAEMEAIGAGGVDGRRITGERA